MSPLTLFLAKLIGLMFLVFSSLMAMNKRAMLAATDELVRSRGLILIGGSFNLAAGLAIVLGHNIWSGGALAIVVTLIGWLVALRGVVWLYTPQERLVQFLRGAAFRAEILHRYSNYWRARPLSDGRRLCGMSSKRQKLSRPACNIKGGKRLRQRD